MVEMNHTSGKPALFTKPSSSTDPAIAAKTTVKPLKKKRSATQTLFRLFIIALVIGLGVTGYLYYKTRQELTKLSTTQGQQEVAKKEVQQITNSLGKLTLLPDEEPVVATILDSKYLATQSAFYQQAENGDKVVVYPKAQKAFIYSPNRNIIVNAGPLIIDQNGQGQQVKVEIRNGSRTSGVATRLKTEIEKAQLLVTGTNDAARKDYEKTILVRINKELKREALTQLAQNLNADVVDELPAGEANSTADFLIIIGNAGVAEASASTAPARPSETPANQ